MNLNQFTIKSQEAIQESQNIAEQIGHQEIKPEHLVAALLGQKDGVIIPVMQKMGVNLASLTDDANRLIDKLPKVSGSGFGQVYASQEFKKILDQSFSLASNMQDEYVSQEHLFLALPISSIDSRKAVSARSTSAGSRFPPGKLICPECTPP